jgi:Putative MetA-pathway of phenol degradation
MMETPATEGGLSWRPCRVNMLIKIPPLLLLIGFAAVCNLAEAQTACSPPSKLYCIVPNQLGTPSSEFSALNEAVGTVVSDLPLASPASGVIYKIDPRFKVSVPVEDTTLGPVLTQRPETIGRHKTYVSIVYQYFSFSEVDGRDLRYVPSVTKTSDLAFVTTNDLGLWAHQFSGYLTYGLANRIDISAAVPILEVHESFTSRGSKIILSGSSTPATSIYVLSSGSATGIGDVVLAIKGTIWKSENGSLAEGLEVRLPTGDAENFLGSGTVGVKPYVSAAYGKRLTVHGDFGYQVNGDTKLVTNSSGGRGQLPNRMFESVGIDWGARKWITFVADILAERVFNADRIAIGTSAVNADYFATIVAPSPLNSYNRTDGALGAKLKFRNFLATMNVTERLDQGGLRSRIIPLGGISYTF